MLRLAALLMPAALGRLRIEAALAGRRVAYVAVAAAFGLMAFVFVLATVTVLLARTLGLPEALGLIAALAALVAIGVMLAYRLSLPPPPPRPVRPAVPPGVYASVLAQTLASGRRVGVGRLLGAGLLGLGLVLVLRGGGDGPDDDA